MTDYIAGLKRAREIVDRATRHGYPKMNDAFQDGAHVHGTYLQHDLDRAIKAEEAKMVNANPHPGGGGTGEEFIDEHYVGADGKWHKRTSIADIMRGAPASPFRPGGQYRTRDGREARVYATDGGGSSPIHGAMMSGVGWVAHTWALDGRAGASPENHWDLMPPTRKVTKWLWVIRRPSGCLFSFLSDASGGHPPLSDGECSVVKGQRIEWEEPAA